MDGKISGIVKRTLEIGWDTEFGGILHYAAVIGGRPEGEKRYRKSLQKSR